MTDSPIPTTTDARVASIVAFINAEANRFDGAAEHFEETMGNADAADRCLLKAGLLRTIAAQIARGDDLRGGE